MKSKRQLESATKNGSSPTMEVRKWLGEVEEFADKVNSVQAGMQVDGKRLFGCLCLFSKQIGLGKKVPQPLKEDMP